MMHGHATFASARCTRLLAHINNPSISDYLKLLNPRVLCRFYARVPSQCCGRRHGLPQFVVFRHILAETLSALSPSYILM